jgi:hypothetical protein
MTCGILRRSPEQLRAASAHDKWAPTQQSPTGGWGRYRACEISWRAGDLMEGLSWG